MKKAHRIFFSTVFSLLPVSPLAADTDSEQLDQVTVSMQDFRILEGENWEGSLSYLNYGSDQRYSIPVMMAIEILNDRSLRFSIRYPGEEQYNDSEKIRISRNGKRVDGFDLVAREDRADGALILTSQGSGRDDDRKADIQTVYTISANAFQIEKNIRFGQDDEFFNRNTYQFVR
ncbi:MAG: hypothetical protein HKN15_08245 [Xanthomonadales bacterium]|nr:hypothetical protein [Xanthomonadales bacterium]